MAWVTQEDFERDLLLFAEYSIPSPSESDPDYYEVPDSIQKYREKMERNQKSVLNSDVNESVVRVVSGRGRGVKDRAIRPGVVMESDPIDDIELRKQIRQVSGLGFSNELIEETVKANLIPEEELFRDRELNLQWAPSAGTKNGSSGSTKSNSAESSPRRVPGNGGSPPFLASPRKQGGSPFEREDGEARGATPPFLQSPRSSGRHKGGPDEDRRGSPPFCRPSQGDHLRDGYDVDKEFPPLK